MRKISIGTRGSKLAVVQAESVLNKLQEVVPGLDARLVKIRTAGDQFSATTLGQPFGQGVFVKELENALLNGEVDLAVHSLKDLPTEIPVSLSLAGVTARLDPRDVLVSRGGRLSKLAPGSKIGTESLRRSVQLLGLRNDLQILAIRGNVETRVAKVSKGEFDGVILAAAALLRLGKSNEIAEYFATEQFTPAIGQGTLALEIRSEDEEILSYVSRINHLPTWQGTTAERAYLSALGGGCRAPIAALGMVSGMYLRIHGMVASADGARILRASEDGNAEAPEQIGKRLAQKMIDMGALKLIGT
jgi:hydroxymethylbilane synthase